MTFLDYDSPLHAASLYIEQLKYGRGERTVEIVPAKGVAEQLGLMFRDAGIEGIDPAQVMVDAVWYGHSFAHSIGIDEFVARSIFVDGILHGVALAAKLRGEL